MNILQTKACKLNDEEKVTIIKNWPGRERLLLITTFKNSEKEACKTAEGLVTMVNEKFKTQDNETILLLQYCKLGCEVTCRR